MEAMIVNNMSQFLAALMVRDDFLLCSHENPDPDSIGSMLALYQILKQAGKKVVMMSSDPVPDFPWPNIEQIQPFSDQYFENVIILDCEPDRTGKITSIIGRAKTTFNIDHHQGNAGLCDYNYIDPEQAATCMIIYQFAKHADIELGYELAQPLYAGIVGDTGAFRHNNTTVQVFLAAADLTAHGAKPAETARVIFESKSLKSLRFMGYSLGKIETKYDDRLVWLPLSQQDFKQHDIDPFECDQLIDYTRMVKGSKIAILFREVAPNTIRIGFRSRTIDIHQLAVAFGGGGHLLAAGAQVEGELSTVVQQVVEKASQLLEGELNEWNH